MKHTLSYKSTFALLCALMLLLVATSVFAQETATLENGAGGGEARSEAREERRVVLKKEFQDRMVNLAQNVERRLTVNADRMANIALRIETRLSKLQSMGTDVSTVINKLHEAKASLQTTRDIIANFGSVQDAMGSDAPRATFAIIRAQFNEARVALQKTHALLLETLTLLKKIPSPETNSVNTPMGNVESAQ